MPAAATICYWSTTTSHKDCYYPDNPDLFIQHVNTWIQWLNGMSPLCKRNFVEQWPLIILQSPYADHRIYSTMHSCQYAKQRHDTWEELADKLLLLCAPSAYWKWRKRPRDYTLKAIAAALDVIRQYFFHVLPLLTPATTETPDENTHHFSANADLSCFSFYGNSLHPQIVAFAEKPPRQ